MIRQIDNFYLDGNMGNAPKITVAITCYNVGKYLARCIESVLAQTYKNLDIILVDDGSRDNSGLICDYYETQDNRIRVVHQNNTGPGEARNLAIDMAEGDYIAFVDGDDYVEPYLYEYLITALLRSGCALSICKYYSNGVDEEIDIHPLTEEMRAGKVSVIDKDELLSLYIEESEEYPIRNAVWNKLYKKSLFDEIRLPSQKYYEDILVTLKLLGAVESAVYVDTPLYHYIIDRKDSIMNQGACDGILTDQIPAYLKRDEYLKSIGRDDLVNTQDYLMYKKLLLLYTEARRDKSGNKKHIKEELEKRIRNCKDRIDEIYGCRIANPHERMRMDLFLWHPWAYNLFMDVNEGIILPLRRKIKK